jgi:uncharacterized membrane-anchored protein YhcB (DUF1043 family)
MKLGILLALLFFTASLKASQLATIDASLLQLALASAELPVQAFFDLTNQTIAICNEEFNNQIYGKILLERIAQALKLKPTAQAIVIAQELAKLILDAPSSLQILYTLTQLTQATTKTSAPAQATPMTSEKDIVYNANQTVESVREALTPFLQQESKKKFFFWFTISFGVAFGITLAASTHHYLKNQKIIFAATQIQLKQTQTTVDQLSRQLAGNKNKVLLQSLTQQHATLQERVDQLSMQLAGSRNEALLQSLTQEHAILEERIEEINNNSRLAITEVQNHSIEGMHLIKQKFENQKMFFDQCLASINNIIEGTQDETPEEITEKITFTDIANWMTNARDIAQLLPALKTTHQINTVLEKSRLPIR